MFLDVLSHFVDRKPELDRLKEMLGGKTQKRVLLFPVEGEQGKTWLLIRFFHECESQGLPVVRLDFDARRSGLSDFCGVARQVRRYLGDDCAPAICACEARIGVQAPNINLQTGAGDAGRVDMGRRGRFDGADIQATGRDAIHFDLGGFPLPLTDPVQQRAEMGRALCSDLARLGRVLLLLDTFDHASGELRAWLNRWLFEPLRRELPEARVVVAGRPECRAFFQNRLWSGLVQSVERLTPLSGQHVLSYCIKLGLRVTADDRAFIQIACHSPAAGLVAQRGSCAPGAIGGTSGTAGPPCTGAGPPPRSPPGRSPLPGGAGKTGRRLPQPAGRLGAIR